ncbi:S-adenosyl-L-methionine-dependent methyltransferase [Trichoderma citrinoviride]|uniref:S-adenosyl-L-methionine-dependent methyltransferase n=1 Tax=Trichoderma citrinoviride TaxID=58853 RepID=A0A2T4B6S8_9HYPO|nr:S-adenosyl-L-methionine-dependent methyltransferase [Trichoderma citrinoviride]PTB65032.1 S-adenosyl-L-methionine-dependent methyltransferase [Trichoderma citrinoviride]
MPNKPTTADLYPTPKVAAEVTAYSERNSTSLPKYLVDYHAWVEETHPHATYMVSNLQAQSLVFFARAFGAKRILEIGSYVGYSALVWAHAVGQEGKVTGLEFSEDYAKIARDAFEKHGAKNVEIIVGDALKTLSALQPEEPYDLIFIDAQKSGYPAYLRDILAGSQPGSATRLLRPGGIIIADNVLRRGLVADGSEENPNAQVQRHVGSPEEDLVALREFNAALAGDKRLEVLLLPVFDGVGFARLLD